MFDPENPVRPGNNEPTTGLVPRTATASLEEIGDAPPIRSVNAEFDPDNSGSSDLLASRAVKFTDRRVNSLVREYGYDNGRVVAAVVSVNPKEFIAATAVNTQEIFDEAETLDEIRLAGESQPPFLRITSDGKIDGHEGRHRLAALANAGAERVPVIVYNREAVPYENKTLGLKDGDTIEGQTLETGRYTTGEGQPLKIYNPIDIKKTNTSIREITAEYGGGQGGDILFSRKATPMGLASARKTAKATSYPSQRPFKVDLQAKALEEQQRMGLDLTKNTPEANAYLKELVLSDAAVALVNNANAIGWYDRTITEAIETLSRIHPEIKTDKNAKFAFTFALANTSNGLKVNKNFELAERAYSEFKETGKFPVKIGIGTAASQINDTFKLYNTMVAKYGTDKVRTLFDTKTTVGALKKAGYKITGEWAGTEVYGSAIIGPKIGNGFYSNLNGKFDQLTMDRWLRRTWGRWTGTLISNRPDLVAQKTKAIQTLFLGMTAQEKKALKATFKSVGAVLKIGTKKDIIATAVAIQKSSTSEKNRDIMNQTGAGDLLRRLGNGLAKDVDGQIEAPTPAERNRIRGIFKEALTELNESNPDLTMADLQALLWYPEKLLYDGARSKEEFNDGYEDAEAPDYANAARDLARNLGVADSNRRSAGRTRTRNGAGQKPADRQPAKSGKAKRTAGREVARKKADSNDILGSRRRSENQNQSSLIELNDIILASTGGRKNPTIDNNPEFFKRLITARPALLKLLPRRALPEIAPKEMPAATDYLRAAEQMDADRNQILADAGEVLNQWHRWARKNRKMATALHKLMHHTTVVGYDPSRPYVPLITGDKYLKERTKLQRRMALSVTPEERLRVAGLLKALDQTYADEKVRKAAKPDIDVRYAALSQEAKGLYENVRNTYAVQRNDMYKELSERIARAEMSDSVRASLTDKLRLSFESNAVRGPYFPLSRFGEHWVVAKDKTTGETIDFAMFENPRDAARHWKKMKALGYDVFRGVKDKDEHEWMQVDSTYAATVTDLINESSDIDRKARYELADQVWQLYLQTLPEMNVRKQHLHRNKTKGWDEDAMRGYASLSLHHAHHITKLRYADRLEAILKTAKAEAAEFGDASYAQRIYAQLEESNEWAMSPTNNAYASWLTSFGFMYQLAVSTAAASINGLQTPAVALPILGGKFGYGKASAALLRASTEFVGVVATNTAIRAKKGKVFLDNDEKSHWSVNLQGDELAFYEEMVRRQLFEKTRVHDLAGISDEGMERGLLGRRWMDMMSAAFHNAEVFNREVTAMASYRLARAAGRSHESALNLGYNVTLDAHFDYSNAGRPSALTSPVMKVVGQYKQYAINMSWRILRDAYVATAAPDVSPEVRREMRSRSLGMVGMSFLMGGFTGFAAYSAIKTIWQSLEGLLGDDDDPREFESEMRTGLKSSINSFLDDEELSETIADYIWVGPLDMATGASIGLRVSPDIWRLFIQEQNPALEGRTKYAHILLQAAGPVVGGTFGMAFDAMERIGEEEYWEGFEKVVPKFVRDVSKAFRYSDKGLTNAAGDTMFEADEISGWQIALQSQGFTPTMMTKQYGINRLKNRRETRIEDRRAFLLRKAALEVIDSDFIEDVSPETVSEIDKFNAANSSFFINGETINNSIRTRVAASDKSERGRRVNPKLKESTDELVDF